MSVRIHSSSLRLWGLPAVVAGLAWIALIGSLDPGGAFPNAAEGPGLTLDETFNVVEGVRLVEALRGFGLGLISLRQVFGEHEDLGDDAIAGYHLPDHPPLGRVWIGLFHNITRAVAQPSDHETLFSMACARTAPATAFALLVVLIGYITGRWYGTTAGVVAALSLVLMPRLFGHAHLASLETFVGLTWAATILAIAETWFSDSPPGWRTSCVCGIIFGCALLTKIQAILLPFPIAAVAVLHWKQRALVPLAIWGMVGLFVFVACWPWLWLDPLNHFQEYLGSTTDRVELHAWYFGQRYNDRDVPWHYPLVMFLATVPIGLQLLGIVGTVAGDRSSWKQPKQWLVFGALAFPLVLFSLPGVPVYDGVRLFLMVFPLWAIFIGRGSAVAIEWLTRILRQVNRKYPSIRLKPGQVVAVFLALQSYGLVALHPCHLSYYNLLVGGLAGADRLGLEPTYWSDSVTRSFLNEVAEAVPDESAIEVIPVMHQFQLGEMTNQSPVIRAHRIRLVPFSGFESKTTRYVLLFRRKADLPEKLREPTAATVPLAELRRDGVLLAALYQLSRSDQPARALVAPD